MSATKRSAAAINDNSTNQPSSQTFTIPGTAAVGDIVVVPIGQNTGVQTFSGPPGWAALTAQVVSGSNMASQLFGKKLVAGEPGSTVTFTSTGGGRMTADYLVVQGGDSLSEIVVATPTVGTTANPVTTPNVTTVETDCFIAEIVFVRSALATQVTLAPGSGLTEDAECNTNFASSPNFALGVYHRTANSTTPGPYGGGLVTANQALTGSHAYTLAITSASTVSPSSTDVGMRVRVIKDDAGVVTVNVYAVKTDGTLVQVSGT